MNLAHQLNRRILPTVISGIIMIPASSLADILSLGSQPQILIEANTPNAGMSMKNVLKKYGEPIKRSVAPGKVTRRNPKITTWNYAKKTVYFERNHVIHTVVHR